MIYQNKKNIPKQFYTAHTKQTKILYINKHGQTINIFLHFRSFISILRKQTYFFNYKKINVV